MNKYLVQLQDDSLHVIWANHTPNSPDYKEVFDVPAGVEKGEDAEIVDGEAQLNQANKDVRIAAESTESDTEAMKQLRAQRNALLTKTDYTQLSDAPLTAQQISDYATYRQELRDLPATVVDVHNPTWPTEPS